MPRKPTKAEVEAVVRSLGSNSDTLFEITQMKAAVRLVRDDDFVDKELRAYIDQSLSLKLNDIFREAVQSKAVKKQFTVVDVLPTVDDELFTRLRTLTSHEVPIYVYSNEKQKLLFYDMIYKPTDDGYGIECFFNGGTHEALNFDKSENEFKVMCPKDSMNTAYFTKKRPLRSLGLRCAQCDFDPIKIDSKFRVLPLPEVYSGKEKDAVFLTYQTPQ